MVVPFGISFAFYADSDKEVNSEVLKILLETLIDLNLVYLHNAAKHGIEVPFLYDAGVEYGRTQVWDTIPDLFMKGRGDCKSLTAAFVAQVRFRGGRAIPQFRFAPPNRMGGTDYHILVMTDGKTGYNGQRIETMHDPSKVLGMPTND